jgi:hypothetical protein
MKTKYLKVMNNNDGIEGAVVFDDKVPFPMRIEITELVRQSEYNLVEIDEEEYNSIQKKFEL